MVYDEEPPALSSSVPPQAAFGKRASTGGPPPPSMFSSNTAPSRSAPAPVPSTDLSSRWKQYEAEKTTGMVGPDGPSSSSSNAAHSDYDLYETPEKQRKSYTGARGNSASSDANLPEALEPRRTYSLTKSGSYNTNDLIAKYSGVSGVPSSSSGIQRTLSNASSNNGNNNGSSNRSHSAIPSSARAEAVKVLTMADEREQRIHSSSSSNQPFQVHRTESGGFRASAVAEPERSSFSFQRSSGNTRRTPSALSGLGLNKSSPDRSSAAWKTGRYAFSDPKFREDDYLEEEEDNIIRPAVVDPLEDENESRKNRTSSYLDNVAFEGDFPRRGKATGNSWSSRYSDNPSGAANNTGATLLDRYDRSHSLGQAPTKSSSRKSAARNMFMSTASNVGGSVRTLKANVSKGFSEAKSNSKVFGKGFSFNENQKTKLRSPAQNRKGGADATGVTNLRTVWKDDTFNDEEETGDHKQHRTWEAVAHKKKRRRKLLLSFLCVLMSAIIIGVSLSQTAWRWKYKNLWRNGNTHMDVTFYATSNTPLGYGATEAQLVQDLRNIPSDAEFVTHLGNLQDASLGMCPAARMPEIAGLLAGQSPVPIYMVPGEHDWIKCPDQLASLARWLASFGTTQAFEQANSLVEGGTTTAAAAGDFDRPKSSPDIFSKLHHGVLFFGLHLVSGIVTEGQGMVIQDFRDEKMAIFIRGTLDRLNGEYRAIVMLGNARPGPQQRNFFDSIREDLKEARVPAAYVHSHSGFGDTEHYPFGGKDVLGGMVAIQASNGGANQTPLKITVGFGKNPFQVGNASD